MIPKREQGWTQEGRNLCGKNIRHIRHEKKLSLKQVEALLAEHGILLDRTNIGRIENQKRSVHDFELLVFACVLQVSLDQLLAQEQETTQEC